VPKKIDLPSDQKASLLLDAVEDRKAVDPVLLDLRGKTLISDFFLICSGTSNVHIRSIAERALERADEVRLPTPRVEGMEVGEWILLDFGDVVLHVMSAETRERYKLEQFWTTPQPKGALPPTPGTAGAYDPDNPLSRTGYAGPSDADDVGDFSDEDLDAAIDDEDEAFFAMADKELPPLEDEDDDFELDEPKGGR
jgi:ribosome-associated protein